MPAVPAEIAVPVWKKPAVMGIAGVVVLALVIVGYMATRTKTGTDSGTGGTGGGGTETVATAPASAPSGPSGTQIQEQYMSDARSLIAAKKYDDAETKLKQAKGVSGGTHGADIDAMIGSIQALKSNKELQGQLVEEGKQWTKAMSAYNAGRAGEARNLFDAIVKMQKPGMLRGAEAKDYLSKKIPDLENADKLLAQARPLAQKKDKSSLEQARGLIQQVIAMGGPRTNDARTLDGEVTRGLNGLAGEAAAAETAAKINGLRSAAAQDIAREEFDAARTKADEIRSLGEDPATVLSAIASAEQRKAGSFQSQFNAAKNDGNALKQLQSELQKYMAASGRIGEAARDVAGKIPAELTRLEAASRPASPAPVPTPAESAPAPSTPRTVSVQVLPGLAKIPWTGALSPGQLVTNRFLDSPLKAVAANVPGEIMQRATAGSSVQLRLDIDTTGKVSNAAVNNDAAGVGQQLVSLAKSSWQFSPPLVNGKPVTTQVSVKVQF